MDKQVFKMARSASAFRMYSLQDWDRGKELGLSDKGEIRRLHESGALERAAAIGGAFRKAAIIGVSGMEESSHAHFVKFLFRLVEEPRLLMESVVSVGYGGTTHKPSLRLPAYIVPGLQLLENLSSHGLPMPVFRVFSGQYAAIRVNGYDEAEMWRNTLAMFFILDLFARKFYPAAREQMVFDFDHPPPAHVMEDVAAVANRFREECLAYYRAARETDLCSYPYADDEHWEARKKAEIWGAFAKMGRRHGGNGNGASKEYAFLHPYLFGDTEEALSLWLKRHGGGYRYRFSLGGRPERTFNIARSFFQQHRASKRIRSFMLICEPGSEPVYYPSDTEPAFTSDAIRKLQNAPREWEAWKKHKTLGKDFQLLADSDSDFFDYAAWAEETALLMQRVAGNHPDTLSILAARLLLEFPKDAYADVVRHTEEELYRIERLPAKIAAEELDRSKRQLLGFD